MVDMNMRFEFDENRKPILKMEDNGVKITISFSDKPKNTNLKQTIVDLLTSAYEQKVIRTMV